MTPPEQILSRVTGVARVALVVLVASTLVAGLTACGIPSEESANPVDDDRVPYRLLDENSGGVAPSEALGNNDSVIYLVRGGRLVAIARALPAPVTLADVLRSLARGPTRSEVAAGIRTALPVEDAPRSGRVERGRAAIDLPESFTELSRDDQVLALAQIVYTVTDRPGVGQVRFTLDGAAIDIPRADRSLTSEPVTREDYLALAPAG